jgi:4-hydroxy-3-methylbut-2-enyl diphosphate reductase
VTPSVAVLAPLRIEARAARAGLPAGTVTRAGMGATRVLGALERGRAEQSPLAVVGFGAAVNPALRPGDVVVATGVTDGRTEWACEAPQALAEVVRARGLATSLGVLYTSSRVASRTSLRKLRGRGVDAVEMESAKVAAVAGERPFAALRVIVDGGAHGVCSPRTVLRGLLAYSVLRRAAPALEGWGAASVTVAPGGVQAG